MSNVQMIEDAVLLSGQINLRNIHEVEKTVLRYLAKFKGNGVQVSLGKVEQYDSSLLALLLVLHKHANKHSLSVEFQQIPNELLAMAKLSGVDSYLKIVAAS